MTDGSDTAFAKACPDVIELAQLLDGEVSENRASVLRRHLPDCATCRGRHERLEAALLALPRAMGEPADDAFVDEVMKRLGTNGDDKRGHRRAGGSGGLALGVAMAAGLVAALALTLPDSAPDSPGPGPAAAEFTARGPAPIAPSPWMATGDPSVEVFSGRTDETPLSASAEASTGRTVVDADDGFRFRASNPGAARQLMIFGVDAQNVVHWFYPAWTDPASNPRSTLLPSGAQRLELKDGVTPSNPAPGEFEIVALFLDTELDVLTVEALIGQHGTGGLTQALNRGPQTRDTRAQMQRVQLIHVPKPD